MHGEIARSQIFQKCYEFSFGTSFFPQIFDDFHHQLLKKHGFKKKDFVRCFSRFPLFLCASQISPWRPCNGVYHDRCFFISVDLVTGHLLYDRYAWLLSIVCVSYISRFLCVYRMTCSVKNPNKASIIVSQALLSSFSLQTHYIYIYIYIFFFFCAKENLKMQGLTVEPVGSKNFWTRIRPGPGQIFFLDPDPTQTRSNKFSGTQNRTRKDPIDQFIVDLNFTKFLMKFFSLIQWSFS